MTQGSFCQSEGEGPGTDYLSSWVRGDVGAWYGRRVVLRNPYTWGGPVPPLFFEIHVQGGGSFWTNRAEAHGQLVLSPVRLPEQLRSSR